MIERFQQALLICYVALSTTTLANASEVVLDCSEDLVKNQLLLIGEPKHIVINEDDILIIKTINLSHLPFVIEGRVETNGYLEQLANTPGKQFSFRAPVPGKERAKVIYEGGTGPVRTTPVEITVRPLQGQAASKKAATEKKFAEKLSLLANVDSKHPLFFENANSLFQIANNKYFEGHEARYRRDKAMHKLSSMLDKYRSENGTESADYKTLQHALQEYKFADRSL